MSVILYSADELREFYQALLSQHPLIGNDTLFPFTPEEDRLDYEQRDRIVGLFMMRLAKANADAFLATYTRDGPRGEVLARNDALFRIMEYRFMPMRVEAYQLWQDLQMLEYNCISNDGRDFITDKDHEILNRIQHALTWSMVYALQAKTERVAQTLA